MSTERNIEIAVQRGLLVHEEVQRAAAHRDEQRDQGRELSLWAAVKELGAIERRDAEAIERRHSTEELGAPTIDGFELVDQIGSGGMGEVFLGVRGREEAAIKLLPARLVRDAEYLGRFQREIQAMQSLDHPHIVHYLAHGTHHGRPYLIMELVRGVSLKEHILQQGALGEIEVRALIRQMTAALKAAWEAGLVHRDVKPANILLGAPLPGSDDPFCAKLCDFGLVKFEATRQVGDPLTHTGIAIGTPHYMSPEQATGDRSADPRHDVYGLGATAYHALQGKTLYSGRSSAVIMYKQATSRLDMRPLRERRISEELIALLEAMLAKPKDIRLADFDAVRERFAALPPVPEGRSRKPIVVTEREHVSERHRQRRDQLAAAPGPLAGPPQRRAFSPAGLGLALVAIAVLALGVWLTLTGGVGTRDQVSADPATLATLISEPGTSATPLTIELAPGRYQGPWRFSSQRPVVIDASGGGVVLTVAGVPDGAAAIALAPAAEVVIEGVELEGRSGTAIDVGAGAKLTLRSVSARGWSRLATVDGELVAYGCVLRGDRGILARAEGRVDCASSVVSVRGAVFHGEGGHLRLRTSRLQSSGQLAQEALHLAGGSLIADRSVIEAPGVPVAVAMVDSALCEIDQSVISGAGVGLRLTQVRAGLIQDTTVQAEVLGVEWQGSAAGWTWSEVRIEAARAVDGFPQPIGDGRGADRERLARLVAQE